MILWLILTVLSASLDPVPAPALTAAEAAHREALARFGVGILRQRNDLPVQAVKAFEAAAKAEPESPGPLRPLVGLYAQLGRDAAAIRIAKQVLALDPADAETAQKLGKLLYDGKQFPAATAVLQQAAASSRGGAPVQRLGVLRDLGRAAAAANDWPTAETALIDGLALIAADRDKLLASGVYPTPKDLDAEITAIHEKLGQAQMRGMKFTAAVAAFRAAVATDPQAAARLDWYLAQVLAADNKPDEALACLTRFLAKRPSGTASYELYADLLRRLGRSREIPGALARYADQHPGNPAIRWVVATELGTIDPAAGDRQFRELAETTTDPAFFTRLVRFYMTANRPDQLLGLLDFTFRVARGLDDEPASRDDKARAAADRARWLVAAVKAEPGITANLLRQATDDVRRGEQRAKDTWELLVGLAERDGRMAEAELLLRPAVRGGTASREMIAQFLELLAKQRKWSDLKAEAQAAINRAGRGPGQNGRPLMYDVYLATAHAELGEGIPALDVIRTLPNLVGADGLAWASLQKPRILNILGRHPDAVAECLDLLVRFPNPTDGRRIRFILSDAYLGQGEIEKAEVELRAILDDDPDDLLALNNLGYNLADQGRKLAEAEAMVRRAIAIDRDERLKAGHPELESGIYLDSLGWVQFRRGKVAEARATLEKASRMPDAATDPVVWDHLGDVCFRLGDRLGAKRAWAMAVELYADSHTGRHHHRKEEVVRKLRQIE